MGSFDKVNLAEIICHGRDLWSVIKIQQQLQLNVYKKGKEGILGDVICFMSEMKKCTII